MNKETLAALEVLMGKIERHVLHATYQEDTKAAYALVKDWIDQNGPFACPGKHANVDDIITCPECSQDIDCLSA